MAKPILQLHAPPSWDSEWAKFCEASRGARGEVRAEARPKIVLAGRGVKTPQGPQDGCRGVASATLVMGQDFARVLKVFGGQNM